MITYSSRIKAIEAWLSRASNQPGRTNDNAVRFQGDTLEYFNAPVARFDPATGFIRRLHSPFGGHEFDRYIPYAMPGLDLCTCYGGSEEHRASAESRVARSFPGVKVLWNADVSTDQVQGTIMFRTPYILFPRNRVIYTSNLDTPISVDSALAFWKQEAGQVLHRMRWRTSRLRNFYTGVRFQQQLQLQLSAVAARFNVPSPLDWFPVDEYNAMLIRFDDKSTAERSPWKLWFRNQYDPR